MFRIDYRNIGRNWRRGGGISAIGEVVPPGLGIDPTDIKTGQSAGNVDCGQKFVGAELVFVGVLAALVYQRNQHFINLFVWPSSNTGIGQEEQLARQGYNLIHWYRGRYDVLAHIGAEPAGIGGVRAVVEIVIGNKIAPARLLFIGRFSGPPGYGRNFWKGRS